MDNQQNTIQIGNKMSIQNLVQQVETGDFTANLAEASGMRLFLLILQNNPISKALIESMRKLPQGKETIFNRIKSHLEFQTESEYLNPFDFSVATYIYTLSEVDMDLGWKSTVMALQTPNLYWAHKMAKYVQDEIWIKQAISVDIEISEKLSAKGQFFISVSNATDQQITFFSMHETNHLNNKKVVKKWVDTFLSNVQLSSQDSKKANSDAQENYAFHISRKSA